MAKKKSRKGIIIGSIAALLILVYASQYIFSSEASNYDELAKCLTGKGAVFYGTEWCPHCQNQKSMFGSSMKYVNFVECDEKQEVCLSEGIEGYPTWKVPGKDPLVGTQSLDRLASAAGCAA